jgi:hypothetical protein
LAFQKKKILTPVIHTHNTLATNGWHLEFPAEN